ncbi:MAG: hypothetical protein JW809_13525 [Pirellulales bacterium]|nr:hypothetical protein [Pirellulales bacterium]
MSLFENPRYRWRETYFVHLPAENRPSLDKMRQALSVVSDHLELANPSADDEGRFESLTILAADDFAAIDVSYIEGDEVVEQGARFAKELSAGCCAELDRAKLDRLRHCRGRFDLLHFEEITDLDDEDDANGMLDPSALLLVLDALVELTDGVAVDPQTGTVL